MFTVIIVKYVFKIIEFLYKHLFRVPKIASNLNEKLKI